MSEQVLNLKELERTNLGPGDVLIVHIGEGWPKSGVQAAQERLQELFPNNKCIVVGPDVSLEVVSEGEAA